MSIIILNVRAIYFIMLLHYLYIIFTLDGVFKQNAVSVRELMAYGQQPGIINDAWHYNAKSSLLHYYL